MTFHRFKYTWLNRAPFKASQSCWGSHVAEGGTHSSVPGRCSTSLPAPGTSSKEQNEMKWYEFTQEYLAYNLFSSLASGKVFSESWKFHSYWWLLLSNFSLFFHKPFCEKHVFFNFQDTECPIFLTPSIHIIKGWPGKDYESPCTFISNKKLLCYFILQCRSINKFLGQLLVAVAQEKYRN